ncbi:MAG: hypothetical protein JWP08_2289 [Bryobacterales bacterium]|jgi:hypothetical protein|nr:hypothetical protein [Bryobacterales bacterium]
MRRLLPCLFLICSLDIASAQSPEVAGVRSDVEFSGVLRDLYFRSLSDGGLQAQQQAAQRAEAEYQRRLFYGKAKHFVDLWTKLTRQMNQRDTVDIKLARKVSEAFHDLEKSNGWPAPPTH